MHRLLIFYALALIFFLPILKSPSILNALRLFHNGTKHSESAASSHALYPTPPQQIPKRVLTRSQQVSRRNFPGPSFRHKGAIYDALQLVLVALDKIDNDNTIFPNYFSRRDRAKVKAVYQAIAGPCNTGNVMLSDLTLRTKDDVEGEQLCDEDTLAYCYPPNADKPEITLCPNFFKKKAFTMVKGAPDPDNDPADYVRCEELQANGHLSYLMETMGATLLHEYTHYNKLMKPIYNKATGDKGYGAWEVYNNLNKPADSYLYYALELFWTEVCHNNWLPPREHIDDQDPDCGGNPCLRDSSSLSSAPSSSDSGSQ
ncbi:MAG: hypothetical protein Q9166_000285 [cf. Caloplaca sp. 2 TL-2023]